MKKNFLDTLNTFNNAKDHGINGKTAEGLFKALIGNTDGRVVSAQGRVDTRKRLNNGEWATFEVKTGSGELAVLNAEGEIVKTCLTADFMVYCYKYTKTTDFAETLESFRQNARVLVMSDFVEILNDLDLVGSKKTTEMYNRPEEMRYDDRLAIKSLGATKRTKCREHFIETYEERGMTIDEFIERYLK